jgi:hypothetical protein
MKEGLPEDDLRAAARVLAEICGLPLRSPADGPGKRARRPEKAGRGSKTMKEPSDTTTPVYEAPTASEEGSTAPAENVPLTDDFIARFKAKLELYHPSFEARGVSPLAAQHFELGYCPADAKSTMKGRVCIPIHNERGELLAYAGRFVGDELPVGEGKYLLPPKFHKSLVLYNRMHPVKAAAAGSGWQ